MSVPELSILGWIGFAGVALVVVGWLAVSFQRPGPRRNTVAWLGAFGFYVALLCFFLNLTRRAVGDDSTAGTIGFGFLAAVFAIGLLLAFVRVLGSLRQRRSGDASATH
jgi:hypothetical protein